MNGGTARLGRAATFAASSVSLAWVAHVTGGAGRPGLVVTAVAFGLLTRLAFGLGSRERGLPALLFGVAAAQLALHVAFRLAQPHTSVAQAARTDPVTAGFDLPGMGMPGMHHVPGMGMAGMHHAGGVDMAGAAHLAGLPALLTSQMLLAHAVAALVVAVSLRRAERLLWCVRSLASTSLVRRLFERIAGWSQRLVGKVPARPPTLRAASPGFSPRPHTRPLGRAARRRGPPLPALP
ncbi:hypothetical protein [Frankia sp. R82]|uniref:hypothetical protein n=1 Tax=Frankia sp. R82 TaxID=2950553 RepID=UPI0020432524|nr:hypothetical protein [Frankia sp. R82]MCM3882997.1 hypothetical protein [Frankia sp. R82]